MRRYLPATICLILGLALAGCRSATSNQTYPNDPLFLSKKPIESTPNVAPMQLTQFAEPTIPPMPNDVLASSAQRLLPEPSGGDTPVITTAARKSSP